MSVSDNAALAQSIYENFNKGDFDGSLAAATEDIEVVLIPFGLTFNGHAGFRDFMGGFKTAFPDLTITLLSQVVTEDRVVNECSWTGTHTGPLASPTGEIPPTGKRVAGAVFCEVWEIRDGKVAVLRNYQDVSTWLRQLGLVT